MTERALHPTLAATTYKEQLPLGRTQGRPLREGRLTEAETGSLNMNLRFSPAIPLAAPSGERTRLCSL